MNGSTTGVDWISYSFDITARMFLYVLLDRFGNVMVPEGSQTTRYFGVISVSVSAWNHPIKSDAIELRSRFDHVLILT